MEKTRGPTNARPILTARLLNLPRKGITYQKTMQFPRLRLRGENAKREANRGNRMANIERSISNPMCSMGNGCSDSADQPKKATRTSITNTLFATIQLKIPPCTFSSSATVRNTQKHLQSNPKRIRGSKRPLTRAPNEINEESSTPPTH